MVEACVVVCDGVAMRMVCVGGCRGRERAGRQTRAEARNQVSGQTNETRGVTNSNLKSSPEDTWQHRGSSPIAMDKRLALVAVALLIVACSAPATSLNGLHQDELCPYNCSGHGRCKFGRCLCDHGFTGISCDRADPTCPNNCAGRGRCDGEKCVCDVGFGGSNCGRALARTCPGSCSGHGTCLADGSCVCNPGFSGAACEVLAASPGCAHSCSGRGWCAGGSCACTYGFSGAACESITQENRCPANCSGHGTCAQHPNPASGLAAAP